MAEFNLQGFQPFDIQQQRIDLSTPSPETLRARAQEDRDRKKHEMFLRGLSVFTGRKHRSNISYPDYGTSSASQQKAQNQSVMTDFYRALDTIAAQYEEEHGKRLTEDQQWAIMKQFNLGPQGMEDAKKYMAAWGVSSKEQRARNAEERAVASAERAIAKDNRALLKEHRESLSNAKVADGVINLLEEYRPLLQGTPLGTAGNRISEAVAKVHKLEAYTDREKLEVLNEVIPRLRSISQFTAEEDKQVRDLEKSVTDAATAATQVEQAAEAQERAREDQEWQRLDREKKSLADTKALGRNITANKLYNGMIDLLADGVPYEEAYATITQQANKNIPDRKVISSLETSLKGLKPEDKRTTESKKFDERMALLRVGKKSVQQQIFDVDKVIQMEIDSVDDNPYFYSYSAPKKQAQAIEQAFHNLMLADPTRIDQEAFRGEFIEFSKGEPTLAQSEEFLKNASKVYKLPVRVLLYIIYGRTGYEELIEQDYAE
jgi:hypothetical protein